MVEHQKYDHREKTLKRAAAFLRRWNGGNAIIAELTSSLATLIINVYKEGNDGWLTLACIDPRWITGYRIWDKCDFELRTAEILENGEVGYILADKKAGLEVHCSSFESTEHLPKKKHNQNL